MPTIITQKQINKLKRKQNKPTNQIVTEQTNRQLRQYYYHLPQWQSLRQSYFAEHPLDELSLLSNKVEVAQDIHHLISPFQTGKTLTEISVLFLDPDNLIALSKVKHGYIHGHPELLTDAEQNYLKTRINKIREKYNFRI